MTSRAGPPRVTVLIPAYNAERFIAEAVESVLRQTFTDFECLVLDDGSTDATPEIVAGFSDPRLELVRGKRNRGYVARLNQGLERARGELIARQDADDRSLPERFERQVAEFDRRPGLVLLGSGYRVVGEDGSIRRSYMPPEGDLEIRWQLLFQNPFVHSAVMMRRGVSSAGGFRYDEHRMPAEDFSLWSALARLGELGNVPEVLVEHRRHRDQVSVRDGARQAGHAAEIAGENLHGIGIELSPEEIAAVRAWAVGFPRQPTRAEMTALCRIPEITRRLACARSAPRSAADALVSRWVRHMASGLAAGGWSELRASGLLGALVRAAPGTFASTCLRRAVRWPVRSLGRRTVV